MLDDIIPPEREKKLGKSALAHKLDYSGKSRSGQAASESIAKEGKEKAEKPDPKPTAKTKHLDRWHHLSNKQKIIVVTSAIFVLIGGSAGAYFLLKSEPATPAEIAIEEKEEPKSNKVPSPLTGVQVKPALAKRPVTGIMIENSLDARPQSGLQEAGVIFEAIAEGGITRFLALYQEDTPSYIGPVRSLRPYYIDWAKGFDASIAHVGGSPQALNQIRNGGKDLDQFFNAGSYWRVSSRAAPHNVYTSFSKLDGLNKSKGYKTSKFPPWPRKEQAKDATPSVKQVDIGISSALYNVRYTYNYKDNTYYRNEGGAKHLYTTSEGDRNPKQLHPRIVVVMVVGYGIASDGHHSDYDTTGRGKVYIFQDGHIFRGTWVKTGLSSQVRFINSKKQPIPLNPGQTWVTSVDSSDVIDYKVVKAKSSSSQ